MEKLSDELKLFILNRLDSGNYRIDGHDLVINLIDEKEEDSEPDMRNIYRLKSGRFNVKIHDKKTKKKINIGTYNTIEEAVTERNIALKQLDSGGVISLEHFRKTS